MTQAADWRRPFSRVVLYLWLAAGVALILWHGSDAIRSTLDFLPIW